MSIKLVKEFLKDRKAINALYNHRFVFDQIRKEDFVKIGNRNEFGVYKMSNVEDHIKDLRMFIINFIDCGDTALPSKYFQVIKDELMWNYIAMHCLREVSISYETLMMD